eukprot:11617921-Alexandrium_andersonii.AAC.1
MTRRRGEGACARVLGQGFPRAPNFATSRVMDPTTGVGRTRHHLARWTQPRGRARHPWSKRLTT